MNPIASSEDEAERARRYWKAAISCLSPQKREVAEEFLRTMLEGGKGADTLFALILLLEANGAFLLRLPENLQGELIAPLCDTLREFRSGLQADLEGQRQATRSIGMAHDEIELANKAIRQTNTEFEMKIRAALGEINISELASRISGAIQFSTLTPMQAALRDLDNRTAKMESAAIAAEKSVETWRKVHLGGIVTNCLAGSLILALALVIAVLWQARAHYRDKLATEVNRLGLNEQAQQKLDVLGIDLQVAPWLDSDGKPMRNGYAVIIDTAEQVELRDEEGRKQAVAFVRDSSVHNRIEELRGAVKEIRRASPAK